MIHKEANMRGILRETGSVLPGMISLQLISENDNDKEIIRKIWQDDSMIFRPSSLLGTRSQPEQAELVLEVRRETA
jgi:hypothetical protein